MLRLRIPPPIKDTSKQEQKPKLTLIEFVKRLIGCQ
jgi:hypothetical protein